MGLGCGFMRWGDGLMGWRGANVIKPPPHIVDVPADAFIFLSSTLKVSKGRWIRC